jgi:hypothetical protein
MCEAPPEAKAIAAGVGAAAVDRGVNLEEAERAAQVVTVRRANDAADLRDKLDY